MRVTRNNIAKAIKARTGYDIVLEGDANIGCYHFCSDDPDTALMLAAFYCTTVYTAQITSFSVDRWVDEFVDMLEKHKESIQWG